MLVGLCKLSIYIPQGHSLKEKRRVLNMLKDKVRSRMNIAIVEVGDQDVWQRAELGFTVVSNDRSFIDSIISKTFELIEQNIPGYMVDRKFEIISF